MAWIDPRYVEHQQKRFLRQDWQRYIRPDWERYMRPDWRDRRYWVGEPPDNPFGLPPGTLTAPRAAPRPSPEDMAAEERERLEFQYRVAKLRSELELLKFELLGQKAYNASQPRVPSGNPQGGQWTDGESNTAPGEIEISAVRRARGHHIIPQSIYRELPLKPETREVFDQATTGPLRAERHGWSQAHDRYNLAIKEQFDRYLERNNVTPEQLTPDQATAFLREMRQSTDPRIRDFNLRIFRQEFQYWLRRGPRGRE